MIAMLLAVVAPQDTTTNCQVRPGTTTCQTTRRQGVDWSLATPPPQEAAAEPDWGAIIARNKANRRAKVVGALVADGRCEEARKVALKAGDFALAATVASTCK